MDIHCPHCGKEIKDIQEATVTVGDACFLLSVSAGQLRLTAIDGKKPEPEFVQETLFETLDTDELYLSDEQPEKPDFLDESEEDIEDVLQDIYEAAELKERTSYEIDSVFKEEYIDAAVEYAESIEETLPDSVHEKAPGYIPDDFSCADESEDTDFEIPTSTDSVSEAVVSASSGNVPETFMGGFENLFLCDPDNGRIQQFSQSLEFIKSIGFTGFKFSPVSVIPCNDGSLIVADSNAGRIYRINDGEVEKKWGTRGDGPGEFNKPYMAAINRSYIYVSDTLNNRIQIFDMNGNFTGRFGNYGTDDEQFDGLKGIYFYDSFLWVADSGNNRIKKYDFEGNLISMFGKFGDEDNEFDSPSAVAVNERYIYVSDTQNHCIKIFDHFFNFVRKIGSYGSEDGELDSPAALDVDDNGVITVSDSWNSRVVFFDSNGRFLRSLGGRGNAPGQFITPGGISMQRKKL